MNEIEGSTPAWGSYWGSYENQIHITIFISYIYEILSIPFTRSIFLSVSPRLYARPVCQTACRIDDDDLALGETAEHLGVLVI